MVLLPIQALDRVHSHVGVICGPPEQQGAAVESPDLLGHQRVPSDKVEHVIGQGGGRVDALGPCGVCDTLRGAESMFF